MKGKLACGVEIRTAHFFKALFIIIVNVPLNAFDFYPYNTQEVIKSLWKQPISSFNTLFTKLVDCYLQDREQLLKIKNAESFAYQCMQIHFFLKKLCVSRHSGSLIHNESFQDTLDDDVPLFSLWKSEHFQPYYDFYALYCDCLSSLFVLYLHESWVHVSDNQYISYRTKAENIHAQLNPLLENLKDSCYEERYTKQVARYYDLLGFAQLEKERIERHQ